MPRLANFQKNNADMLSAADRCIELRQFMPALALIYSHIDTLAWAASKKTGTDVRSTFESWVKRWLIPHLSTHAPDVTPTDLYAARCGILHTLTGKSNLSKTENAREIAYAWGTGSTDVLKNILADTGYSKKLVVLHYQELLKCVTSAVTDFVSYAESDSELESALEAANSKHYTNIPIPPEPK